MKTWHLPALLALSLTVLGGCATLNDKQGEWIFQPSDRTWRGGLEAAQGMQDVWVEFDSALAGKPVKLHGLWHAASPAQDRKAPVMLYLHGARWNVTGSAPRIRRMQELGFSVLAVDYRGFGKSDTTAPTESLALEDARAAWDWLATRYPDQPRYIFGHSLGGAIAIALASNVTDEAGTIVEGTFTSIPDVFNTMKWGWLPLGGLITQRFDSLKKVAHIGSPLLVVHGEQDQLIKPELGRQLFDAAVMPKAFVLVPGGSHHNTNSVGQAQYREALAQLFQLPGSTTIR
jgi:alpha-beta hydrolase superfamily lysophospholipase